MLYRSGLWLGLLDAHVLCAVTVTTGLLPQHSKRATMTRNTSNNSPAVFGWHCDAKTLHYASSEITLCATTAKRTYPKFDSIVAVEVKTSKRISGGGILRMYLQVSIGHGSCDGSVVTESQMPITGDTEVTCANCEHLQP